MKAVIEHIYVKWQLVWTRPTSGPDTFVFWNPKTGEIVDPNDEANHYRLVEP